MKTSIALIGFGTVGSALYERILNLPQYEISGVAVKHPEKHKDRLPEVLMRKSAEALIARPETEVILEAIDDSDAALEFAVKALEAGKTYITASKKMVASNLGLLHRLEETYDGNLLYEAAVGGAVPILRTLREHLAAEPVKRVRGILNGTCNYILTQMQEAGADFDTSLKEAQLKGYAETDASSDIDALDTYYKSLIIARTLSGTTPELARVVYEGIRDVAAADVAKVRKEGGKVKLIADIQREGDKFKIDIRPTAVNPDDPLHNVDGSSNAVTIEGVHSGTITLQGLGAGGHPTASAMVGDLMNIPAPKLEKVKKMLTALR